jgi:hypothetical protein
MTTTFPIQIDATQLFYRYFMILGTGVTQDWIDSRTVQTLHLEPGAYQFQIASGYPAVFTFYVTAAGKIDYSTEDAAFLTGKGTSVLVVTGLQVTLDARYLAGSGVLLANMRLDNTDWISYKTCRLLPSSYSVQQGSGVVTSFSFQLNPDGTFSYDQSQCGGFLGGNGTSTLEFFGYPLLVDARAAKGSGLTIQPIWGMPFSPTAVEFANLLPAQGFMLQVNAAQDTKAIFLLDVQGNFSFDSSLSSYLELESFNGLTLLKVKGLLPTH